MKKDIAGLFNLRGGVAGFSKMCVRGCGAGFFLKKWCGRAGSAGRDPVSIGDKKFCRINKSFETKK